jgi:hypothetical protein
MSPSCATPTQSRNQPSVNQSYDNGSWELADYETFIFCFRKKDRFTMKQAQG